MVLNRCPFCDHGNPPDAAFCSHCGAQVDLAPCPKCGAVNKNTAVACYQCKAPLSRNESVPPPAEPLPSPSRSRKTIERVAGVAAVVLVVSIAWFASRGTSTPSTQTSPSVQAVPVAQPAASSNPAPARSAGSAAPSGAGTIGVSTPAHETIQAKAPGPAAQPPVESPRAAARRARAAATEATEPTPDAPVVAREARPPPAVQPKPAATATVPCTESKAALGLCVMKDNAGPAPSAPGTQAAKAAGQDPPRSEACTEAVAALGLCAPETSTGRP